MKRASRRLVALLAAAGLCRALLPADAQADVRAESARPVDLLAVVVGASKALLESGRDRWGPDQTALLASVIDRRNGKPPPELPAGSAGVRLSDRTTPCGSNVNMQQNVFRTFYLLSEITGDRRYANAADAALLDFIRRTQSPVTGLVAWGEHLCWDLCEDRAAAAGEGPLIHEPKKPLVFWDFLYKHEPARMLRYAEGIWEHQIFDHQTGNFSRHARYGEHRPGKNYDFTKEAGHFIDIWSRAYAESHNDLFGLATATLVGRYAAKLNARNLLEYDSVRANYCNNGHNLTLACELHDAAPRLAGYRQGELVPRIDALARAIDRGFLDGAHRPDVAEAGFIATCTTETAEPRDRDGIGSGGYSVLWGMGYGRQGTAMVAMHCFRRADQLQADAQGQAYRDLAMSAAECYAKNGPPATSIDVWPVEYGTVILMHLEANKHRAGGAHLRQARRRAEEAVAMFWDASSPLPKCSSLRDHFETITGAETLLLALLAVHATEKQLSVEIPFSDIDR